MSILDACFDVLWPRTCAVCGASCDRPRRHVCAACLMRLPFLSAGAGDAPPCEPPVDAAAAAWRYEDDARRLLAAFKFKSRFCLRDDIVDAMEGAARARFDTAAVDLVVPFPIAPLRRFDRGYDQSAVLAAAFARRIDRICRTDILRRTGHPARQSSLGATERRANVRGTVAVDRPCFARGRTVLVVDDITTTGATFSEAARVLKEAGAFRVWCLAAAYRA